MMTKDELYQEFWLLTSGILQDSTVETSEARVVKRWLEEHADAGDFGFVLKKIDRFLTDGYIDRFESQDLCSSIGTVLRILRQA